MRRILLGFTSAILRNSKGDLRGTFYSRDEGIRDCGGSLSDSDARGLQRDPEPKHGTGIDPGRGEENLTEGRQGMRRLGLDGHVGPPVAQTPSELLLVGPGEVEVAKREAAAVLAGPNQEISKEEIDRALRHMRTHWQKTYGLVEVG